MASKPTQEALRKERLAKDEKRDAVFLAERKRIRTINDEKTARLRALRLAKEAQEREIAEREAAERAANPQPVKTKKKRAATAPAAG